VSAAMDETEEKTQKMQTYRVSTVCSQRFEFDVKAASPENASKRINEWQKRNASMKGLVNVEEGRPSGYTWVPPEECAYIVTGGLLPDGSDGVFAFWDGEKIVRKKIS
jgi:hypothetical protein